MSSRSATEQRLALQLHRWVAASGELAHRYAEVIDLNPSDFAAILYLWEQGLEDNPVTASQLAKHLKVTPAAVTYLVERLVKRGLLERAPNPEDRRQVLLSVSADGGHLGHGFLAPQDAWLSRTLAGRSDEELTTAIGILADLTDALAHLGTHHHEEPNHD